MGRFRTFVVVVGCLLALTACATPNADHAGAQRQPVNSAATSTSEGGGGGGY
jgi:hypothetical protein